MVDEELKESVEKNLFFIWENYAERYFEDFFDKANDYEKYRTVYLEQAFLEKRALNPAVLREVQSQVNSNTVIQKHRLVIVGYIFIHLSSRLSKSRLDSDASMRKLLAYLKKKDKSKRYDRRHVQNILKDYYPEFFFKPDEKKKTRDERESVISSVLIPEDKPYSPFNQDAVDYIKYDRAKLISDNQRFGDVFFSSTLMAINPEILEGFITFRKECNECLSLITTKPKVKEHLKSIVNEEEKFPVFFKLYLGLNNILTLHWFNGRRKRIKEQLLNDEYYYKIDKNDIQKVLDIQKELFGSINITPFLQAADLMPLYGMSENAKTVYIEILKLPDLDPFVEAHFNDNLGIMYRNTGNYKKTISHLKKALPYFEEQGDIYRSALIIRNIGEANYKLGRKDRCFKLFREAEELVEKSDDIEHKVDLLGNIAISLKRVGDINRGFEYLLKAQESIPESRFDLVEKINQWVINFRNK